MLKMMKTGALISSLLASTIVSHAADGKKEPPPPTPKIGEEVTVEFFKYLKSEVNYDCTKEILQNVQYDIRAPGILYGTNHGSSVFLRFDHVSVKVNREGNIAIGGDSAEIQTNSGGWVHAKYLCFVNVNTKQVIEATIGSGRYAN